MKKTVLLMLIAALASASYAFADDEPNVSTEYITPDVIQGDIMLIDAEGLEGEAITIGDETATPPETGIEYISAICKGAKITDEYLEAIDENENEIRFVVDEYTLIIDEKGEKAEIKDGDAFTAFVNGNSPAPMVLPTTYTADVIVIDGEGEASVDVGTYKKQEEGYINAAGSLVIHTNDNVFDANGEKADADIDGKTVVALYTMSTRSIPPQTTPEKIIVLNSRIGDGDMGAEEEEVTVEATKLAVGELTVDITDIDGVKVVPVRAIAEALGLEVAWDGELKAVTVGTVPMGVNFVVGTNAYNKARMMPQELEAAPVIVDDRTYVPVSFFETILECEKTQEADVISLSRKVVEE